MQAVVRNTAIQGTLSIIFVTLAIVVIITALIAVIRAYRGIDVLDQEDPAVPSHQFAPAGLIATAEEKELEKEWTRPPSCSRCGATDGGREPRAGERGGEGADAVVGAARGCAGGTRG